MGSPPVAVKATTPLITAVVFIPDCVFVTIPPILPTPLGHKRHKLKDIIITPPEREKS